MSDRVERDSATETSDFERRDAVSRDERDSWSEAIEASRDTTEQSVETEDLGSQKRLSEYAEKEELKVAVQQETEITQERRDGIDRYVADKAMATTSALGITFDQDGGELIGAALVGQSGLGQMNEAEQRYMADQAVQRWMADQSLENVVEAAHAVRTNASANRALAAALADPVASIQIAHAAGGASWDAEGASDFRAQMLETATELDPLQVAKSFSGHEQLLGRDAVHMSQEARKGLLEAVVSGQIAGPAADRLVTSMFVLTKAEDLEPGMLSFGGNAGTNQQVMADALAIVARPGSTPVEKADREILARRLSGLLASQGGRDLLLSENVPPEMRSWAFEKTVGNPAWTADTLAEGWESDAVTAAFSRDVQRKYAARGTEGQLLAGNALRNTVGQAFQMRPDNLPPANETVLQKHARLNAGMDYGYYSGNSHAARIADMIEQVSGPGAKVSVVPVVVTSGNFGAAAMTVFRVENANGGVAFVDHQGKKYDDLEHWQTKNELPAGRMSHPEGMRLGGGMTAPENTRVVVDTVGEHAGQVLDYAAVGVGVAAGVAIVVGTGGTAALVAAGAAGAYSAGRSGAELYADFNRGVDVTDFSNPQNRSRWLEVAAGTLSLGAIGSGVKAANAIRNGAHVTAGFSRTAAGLAIAADGADALAMTDQAVQLAQNWDRMSNGQRAAGMLNVAFWGGMAAASTKAGGNALQDAFSFTRLERNMRTGTPFPMRPNNDSAPGGMRVAYDMANGQAANIHIETGPGPINRQMLELHTTREGAGTTAFRERGTNISTYNINTATGRPNSVEATLREDFGTTSRGDNATEIGHIGGKGYDGGHLVAHRFMGDTVDGGIAPQVANLNRGAWSTMENEWADWLTKYKPPTGKHVEIDVKIDVDPPGADVPDGFDVEYRVFEVDNNGNRVEIHNDSPYFDNKTGEKFERVYFRNDGTIE